MTPLPSWSWGLGDGGMLVSILSILLVSTHSHLSPKSRKQFVTEFPFCLEKALTFPLGLCSFWKPEWTWEHHPETTTGWTLLSSLLWFSLYLSVVPLGQTNYLLPPQRSPPTRHNDTNWSPHYKPFLSLSSQWNSVPLRFSNPLWVWTRQYPCEIMLG